MSFGPFWGFRWPLATISKARDIIRSLHSSEPVTVYLRGGTYELTKPVVFTPRDSGTEQAPITYCAYWQTGHRAGGPYDMTLSKKYALLDNHLPTIICNNRFANQSNDPRLWIPVAERQSQKWRKWYGHHSWGIDLDDGATNYRVNNNLCLGCSIKLREGYYRTVENNVFIGPHPPEKHMGFEDGSDVYRRNIYVNTKDGQA